MHSVPRTVIRSKEIKTPFFSNKKSSEFNLRHSWYPHEVTSKPALPVTGLLNSLPRSVVNMKFNCYEDCLLKFPPGDDRVPVSVSV